MSVVPTLKPWAVQVRWMRCIVVTLRSPVTAPVTRYVHGPMMLTWHRPPPAPASMPARPAGAKLGLTVR